MAIQQDFIGHDASLGIPSTSKLKKRMLIVEDDCLLTFLLEDQLADLQYDTLPASNVAGALELIKTEIFDGAILDVNLAGETIYPVAAALRERKIPFAFSTGSGNAAILEEFRARPALGKPYSMHDLQRVLNTMFPNGHGV